MADHSITIDVIGRNLQETVSLLKEIRDDIKTINSTPVTVKVNTANATRALNLLRQELGNVAQVLSQGNRNNSDAMMEFLGERTDELLAKLTELGNMSIKPEVDTSGMDEAVSKTEQIANGLSVASSVASSLSTIFSGLGDFGGMFADSVGAMSSMFKVDAVGTAKRYLTAMATRAVTGQISGIIERYDIMNTFVPYMELAGVDAVTARASLDAVDQSIRGIPIGLDEAAFRLRKYQMYMGDVDKATQFTIGIQKAITAGGASEQMKTTAYTQIDRLLATGKLGQSRQWLSLFNGLGVSLKFLREELALDPTADLKQIATDLSNGTIPVEDFISAIERLADNEGLDRALEIYKGTIEAWRSNINNAIKRGGQNIMENVNGVMNDVLGYGITGVMRRVRDGIDDVSKEAGRYIQSNPQHVQTMSSAIGGLLDKVMSLDGGRFVDNLITNTAGVIDAIGDVIASFPDGFLEDFVAFATTWAGPMATVMEAAQSGLGIVLGVFERLKKMDPAELIEKIVQQIENMADIVAGLLDLIPDGLLGDLMAFGLVWGRPLANVLQTIGGALQSISTGMTASSFTSSGGLIGQLTWLVQNQPMLALAAGAVAAIATAYFEMKQYVKDIEEADYEKLTANLGDLEKLNDETNQAISNAADRSKELADNIATISLKGEEAHTAAANIRELNEQIDELSKPLPYSNMSETRDTLLSKRTEEIERLASLFPELTLEVDKSTGALTENSQALLDQADAYIDYMTNVGLSKAYREGIEGESEQIFNLQRQREDIQRRRKDAIQYYQRTQNDVENSTKAVNDYYNTIEARGDTWTDAELVRFSELQDKADETSRANEDALEAYQGIGKELNDVDSALKEHFETIDKYGRSVEELRVAQSKFAGTEWVIDGMKTSFEELDQNLQNILADYSLMREEQTKALTDAVSGFEALENLEVKPLSQITGTLEGNNSIEQAYIDDLNAATEWLSNMINTPEGQEWVNQYGEALTEIFSQGFEGRDIISGLVDAMFENPDVLNSDTLNAYVEEAMERINLNEQGGGLMAEIMGKIMYGADYEKVKNGNLGSEEFAWVEGMKESVVGPIAEIVNAFSPEGEIGASLGDGVTQTVEGVVQSVHPIEEAFGDAASAADNLDEKIGTVASTASGKAGDFGSLTSAIQEVGSAAALATGEVNALQIAINNLPTSKTITISVNMFAGGVVGAAGGFGAGLSSFGGVFAKGGLVDYLADGGFPGIARGTDTIPAWLTPGEYVMKRSAVGMFGSRFMDRINKMDIGGAFDALMSRISNPMHMGGNTYNRDNHATVNNYFYGDNGQNYSQRKAYRYAGSL